MSVWTRHPHEPSIPPLGDPGNCPACVLWAAVARYRDALERIEDLSQSGTDPLDALCQIHEIAEANTPEMKGSQER